MNTSFKSSYSSCIKTSKESNQSKINMNIFIGSLSLIVKSCNASGSA